MWNTMFNWMSGSLATLGKAQEATLKAAARTMALTGQTYARMWGLDTEDVVSADRRFEDDAWQENPPADFLKQTYLITAQWMGDMADGLEVLDPGMQQRVKFWTQQLADSMSPTNFPLTNPVVMQEAVRTGGMSLVRGMQNLLTDVQRGRVSQVAEDAFEVGVDLAVTPGKVVFRNPLIELIQYTPTTEKVRAVPTLVIPPWINKFYVMDMRPDNSMLKYLVDSGFTVFTISWKNPDKAILDLEWDDYMDLGPLEALRVIKKITGAPKVNMVGYCLGGIAEQVTLAYLAAQGDQSVNSATYFATHQDFSDVGDIAAFLSEPEAYFLDWLMTVSGGYLDGRNMAATFNMLRANDLLWSYVVNNYLLGKTPPAFDLLYWNSDGTRVPGKVHMYLIREFFLGNKLKEPGGLVIKGTPIDTRQIKTPTYCVAATGDHIVPWQGTYTMREMTGGPLRFVLTKGGHIAGIINPPGKKNRAYWTNESEDPNPDTWLAGATEHEGSWWPDWVRWLKRRSGKLVAPLKPGSEAYPALIDAPGTYVLEA